MSSVKNPSFLLNQDIITDEANKPQILPTLVPFETSSHEQEDEELSSEGNANASKERELEASERKDKSAAVLMSDDELAELLRREEEEEEGEESTPKEEQEGKSEVERKLTEEPEEDESEEDAEMLEKEEVVVQKISPGEGISEEPTDLFEETDGSTESEIPADLDYAADSGLLQPLHIVPAKLNPSNHDIQPLPQAEEPKEIPSEKDLPATGDEAKKPDAGNVEGDKVSAVVKEQLSDLAAQDLSQGEGAEVGRETSEKEEEEEKGKNESGSHPKVRVRKQRKSKRARKHSLQSDELQAGQEQSQQEAETVSSSSSGSDNAVQKAKRRRTGKWVRGLLDVFT